MSKLQAVGRKYLASQSGKKPRQEGKKVRVVIRPGRVATEFRERAITAYRTISGTRSVTIPLEPPSVNQNYKQGLSRGSKYLDPVVRRFRNVVAMYCRSKWLLNPWPTSTLWEIIIIVGSPNFISKKHTVRANDLDNKFKSLIDGICDGVPLKDEDIWRIVSEKIYSDKSFTEVTLVPIGDLVELEK